MTPDDVGSLDWEKGNGLLPAIVQHARTGKVLMLGYMNDAALRETLAGGRVMFYSRSRETLWLKGETSGHFLRVQEIRVDCDQDALVLHVRHGSDMLEDERQLRRARKLVARLVVDRHAARPQLDRHAAFDGLEFKSRIGHR